MLNSSDKLRGMKNCVCKLKLMAIFCLFALNITGCGSASIDSYRISNTTKITEIKNLHNGDAKFWKDKVITSVNGILTLINLDGKIEKTYEKINANWIDGIAENNILVYGNFENEIGIILFDDHDNIVWNDIIMTKGNLQIDPTISFVDGVYYLTATEVIGNVNNSDVNMENGEYILHLYSSVNLKDWILLSDIVDEYYNIEDVDIIARNNCIYVTYEKEVIDKGKSAIILKKSDDHGKSWSNEVELLPAEADHEPAVFWEKNGQFILYYSSDILAVGESYMGSRMYYSIYDSDLNILVKDYPVCTEVKKGILLYDISKIDGEFLVLYSHDYLTTCDLVIEKGN